MQEVIYTRCHVFQKSEARLYWRLELFSVVPPKNNTVQILLQGRIIFTYEG